MSQVDARVLDVAEGFTPEQCPGRVRFGALPWSLTVVTTALLAIGLVAVASASATLTPSPLATPIWKTAFGRQAIFVVVGAALVFGVAKLAVPLFSSFRATRWIAIGAMFLTLAALVAALVPGISDSHRGSQRWLPILGGSFDVRIQPSEMAKVTLIAFLSALLTGPRADPWSFRRGVLMPAIALAVCVGLIGLEDFGTAVLLLGVGGLMLVVAGCRFRHLVPLALLGLAGLAVLLVKEPYRMNRLKAHADIWSDPQGAGYQPLQSLAAVATGGWTGVGLGTSVQKFGYLPESHTDFIFSIICEETGFLGALLLLSLYSFLIWLGWRTMQLAVTPFERLLAFGLTLTFGLQAAMNIAVVTALTPTKGISLPLISSGGSGTLTHCIALGLLTGIAARGYNGKPDVNAPS
jgi:cell division protein FtsW